MLQIVQSVFMGDIFNGSLLIYIGVDSVKVIPRNIREPLCTKKFLTFPRRLHCKTSNLVPNEIVQSMNIPKKTQYFNKDTILIWIFEKIFEILKLRKNNKLSISNTSIINPSNCVKQVNGENFSNTKEKYYIKFEYSKSYCIGKFLRNKSMEDLHCSETGSLKQNTAEGSNFKCFENVNTSQELRNGSNESNSYCSDINEENSVNTNAGISQVGASFVDTKKVRFDMKPTVHVMRMWDFAYRAARKGQWENYARDRVRFQLRIQRTAKFLEPVLTWEHRKFIYNSRFSK